jgi:hypothetical protein
VSGSPATERELTLVCRAVARLRVGVLAVVFGLAAGCGLALATVWLVVRGGDPVGPHLGLLAVFFPGYAVTWPGVVIGLLYGFLTGAVAGGFIAGIYNRIADRRERRR